MTTLLALVRMKAAAGAGRVIAPTAVVAGAGRRLRLRKGIIITPSPPRAGAQPGALRLFFLRHQSNDDRTESIAGLIAKGSGGSEQALLERRLSAAFGQRHGGKFSSPINVA